MAKAMSELCKLKSWQGIQDVFNMRNNPNTIQILPLILNLGCEVWTFREKKGWIGLFKVLGITDADIIIDTENDPVTFWNMYIKLYNYPMKDTIIYNLEKTVDIKILVPLDYLETEKPHEQRQLRKSHFINNLIYKMADIFMSHKEYVDYKFALKLYYERVITIIDNPFK